MRGTTSNKMDTSNDTDTESLLNLSCESSPFEDEEDNGLTDGDDTVKPYLFEPYLDCGSSTDSETERSDEPASATATPVIVNRSTLDSGVWCQCNMCPAMPTHEEECTCCTESSNVEEVSKEHSQPCITQHPGFGPVCLNVYVLKTAYYQYRQQYKEKIEDSQERNRYIAYRQFVRWCYGYLGKHNRVPIPACVVTRIREAIPSQHITGFKFEIKAN